jgi:hypothetical protein
MTKVLFSTLSIGAQFKYCGRLHTLLEITVKADGNYAARTNHHTFNFPANQLVTLP